MKKIFLIILIIFVIYSCNNKKNPLNKILDSGSTQLIDTIFNYQDFDEKKLYFEVENLLKNGADPNLNNEYNQTPLGAAILMNNFDIVCLLFKYGVNVNDINGHGESILVHAMSYNNVKIMKYLIDKGANVNYINKFMDDSDSILIKAVKQNNEELIRYLLKHGANKNYRNKEGKKAEDFVYNNDILEKMLK